MNIFFKQLITYSFSFGVCIIGISKYPKYWSVYITFHDIWNGNAIKNSITTPFIRNFRFKCFQTPYLKISLNNSPE